MIYDDEPVLNFNLNSNSQVRMQLKIVELANKTYWEFPDTVITQKEAKGWPCVWELSWEVMLANSEQLMFWSVRESKEDKQLVFYVRLTGHPPLDDEHAIYFLWKIFDI